MKQNVLQIRVIMTFVQGLGKKYNTATSSRIIIACAYITIREWVLGPGDGARAKGVTEVEGVVVAEELVDVRRTSTRVRIQAHHDLLTVTT
uniref:Uncharacterized protein n=1 Tax=Arundo donax TaxID=35708 RepID=A0A0A9HH46_ARUDO